MEFSRFYWSSIWWRRGEPTSLEAPFKPLFSLHYITKILRLYHILSNKLSKNNQSQS